jgi:mono/diheme cytochrome c family protein
LVAPIGCSPPGGPDNAKDWDWRPDAGGATNPPVQSAVCAPARASEPLPARVDTMSTENGATPTATGAVMYTEDLFNIFKADCGGCHVEASLGSFHVTAKTFTAVVDHKALDAIRTDDPAKYMPPQGGGGKPYSQRASGDPIFLLSDLLEKWIAQGRPDTVFSLGGSAGDDNQPAGMYLVSPDVGLGMTNIGNCVPGPGMVGTSTATMDKLDTFFASATEATLPMSLADTDLSTLDAAELARNRVIAYAPQYPLWTDDAGKLRYLRVPSGQSIRFNKQTQQFDIPPNTRFYKTFLKKVIDRDGNETFRKIETRVIVARPDKKLDNGTIQNNALFATYVWNEDETKAELKQLPLRNGDPFTDILINITVDEPKEQMIRDSMPDNLSYALGDGNPGLKRHYAIPGSQRCIQCHMGSASANFVLGFLPVQVARRPTATGGAYEETGPDELNQLQRLIDYGVITGMSADDVVPLEKAEGPRAARNDYELKAQAYMLGNCANCHNPRGFPSVKNPELKDLLDFLPSPTGGIFQFPLERYSPLRRRGFEQDVPMPYITPSPREFPVADDNTANWQRKWAADCSQDDDFSRFICGARKKGAAHLGAPWRSLLYRNIDTPFMYADDFVVFPHMPMNSPGFDCRITQILGDWMVSIPSARKNPEIDEDAVPPMAADRNAQPYAEVTATSLGYQDAVDAAKKRLDQYHAEGRYSFCPNTSDIVDPDIIRGTGKIVPASDGVYDLKQDPPKLLQPDVGVPVRAHWVITDLTDPPGDWYPRRADWKSFVVDGIVDNSDLSGDATAKAAVARDRAIVKDTLTGVTLTAAFTTFARTALPYGLWVQKDGCQFTGVPRASAFDGTNRPRPRWMDINPGKAPAPDAPVYLQTPGAAVFTNVCINCHGPQADSKGLMAEAIMNMTGGTARVANFRDGLFGPVTSPGANRQRVFGAPEIPLVGMTPEDWSARYMAWMALGGTSAKIPPAILNIVGTTRVLGEARSNKITTTGSPNMLKLAQELCHHTLPLINPGEDIKLDTAFYQTGVLNWGEQTGLIDGNADAEMWQSLCSFGNRPVVRVVKLSGTAWEADKPLIISRTDSLYWADHFPANSPVLDHRGQLRTTLTPDNLFPLCVLKPTDPNQLAAADAYLADPTHLVGPKKIVLPYCPAALFDPTQPSAKLVSTYNQDDGTFSFPDGDKWATRGAINAGMAVFLYLKDLESSTTPPQAAYNHCN